MEDSNNNEAVLRPTGKSYSLDAQGVSPPSGGPMPTQNPSSASRLMSATAAQFLADADACGAELDESMRHFVWSQMNYIGPEPLASIDDTSKLSQPLNEKVGRRARQPKRTRKKQKKDRQRHQIWKQTEQKQPAAPMSQDIKRVFETTRIESIMENDVFLQPEGGIDFCKDMVKRQIMRQVGASLKAQVPDLVLEISQIAATINLVMSSDTWRRAMQIMYIYLCPRLKNNKTVLKEVTVFLKGILGDAFLRKEAALSMEENKDEEEPKSAFEWLLFMKNLRSNWGNAKTHPLFSNFTKLVSVLCYTGIVKIDEDAWTATVADAVMPGVLGLCKSSSSLLDAILDVIEYVAQAAAIYIDTGDLQAAIADKDNGGLAYEIARITSNHTKFLVGLLSQGEEPVTDDQHYNDVMDMVTRLSRLINNSRNPVQSNLYATQLIKIEAMRLEVHSQLERSPSRVQPWACYLNGPPGGGKSTLMGILARACVNSIEGKEFDERKVYDRNSTDAFWSKAKSDQDVCCFNDVGASKDEAVLRRQYEEMLRVTDVARYYPPMPQAAEKGLVDWNGLITLCSGNGLFPHLGQCVNDIGAFTRRYRLAPFVEPKKEFCSINSNGQIYLDSGKIEAAREKGILTGPFDETADIYMFETRPGKVGVESVPIQIYGQHHMTVTEFITFMVQDFKEHYSGQLRKMKSMEAKSHIPFDAMSEYVKIVDTIPLEQRSTQCENRFISNSPALERMNELQQTAYDSEANRQRRNRGKPGRNHAAVPYDQTLEELAAQDQYDLEQFYAEEDSHLQMEASALMSMLNKRKNFSKIDENNIIPLGNNSAAFNTKWKWVPKMRLEREWLPAFVWNAITPSDRGKITEACHQNMSLWSIFSIGLTMGPMALFAPLALCAFTGLFSAAAGSMFLVNTGRKLHASCLYTSEAIFLASNWRRVDVARIAGVTGLIVLACQLFRSVRKMGDDFSTESEEFSPSPMNDPYYRNLGVNPWNREKDVIDKGHLAATTRTTTSTDLLPLTDRVLYAGAIYRGKDEYIGTIQGVVFHTGYMMVAEHYLQDMRKWADGPNGDPNAIFKFVMTRGPLKKGAQFSIAVDYRNYYKVPDADIAVIRADKTGKMPNMVKHFPIQRKSLPLSAYCVSRKPREDVEKVVVTTSHQRTINVPSVDPYVGFTYERENHYKGLCGAMIVSQGAQSHIMGIHTAGSELRNTMCVAAIVTQADLTNAISYFVKQDISATPYTKEGSLNFVEKIAGFVPEQEPHYKSPIRFTGDGAQFSVLGTTGRTSTFVSNAVHTPIAEAVSRECGVDHTKYVPPVSKPKWYGPQTNADAFAVSGEDFPPDALKWAVEDLWSTISEAGDMSNHEHGPCTRFEVINGTGKKFEEPLNRQSVWGKPLEGKKYKDMFQNHDPAYKPYPEYEGPIWDVNKDIHELLDQIDVAYSDGHPIHPVFTSCIKDEIHLKKKARVFEVAPMPITMVGRELTLKTSSFLRLITNASECTVGANCHGPDGTLLYSRITQFGLDRLIAGDFSKYDKRMPTSVLKYALSIYKRCMLRYWDLEQVELERRCRQFDAWSLDVVYPTIDYFGDILQMRTGDFPSGIPITADVNGLGNSIIHRCVYYLSYIRKTGSSDDIPPFQTMVAFLTYGDDSAGSVSPECDWFNMTVIANICGEFGIKYTDPAKSSVVPEFLNHNDLDFLKRNFNVVHECGHHLGALDVNSIYKPLCMVLWDKEHHFNLHELTIENINGSMYEAFNHGREFYNKHQEAMRTIAQEFDMWSSCRHQVSMTFDERLIAWHETYAPQVQYLSEHGW